MPGGNTDGPMRNLVHQWKRIRTIRGFLSGAGTQLPVWAQLEPRAIPECAVRGGLRLRKHLSGLSLVGVRGL